METMSNNRMGAHGATTCVSGGKVMLDKNYVYTYDLHVCGYGDGYSGLAPASNMITNQTEHGTNILRDQVIIYRVDSDMLIFVVRPTAETLVQLQKDLKKADNEKKNRQKENMGKLNAKADRLRMSNASDPNHNTGLLVVDSDKVRAKKAAAKRLAALNTKRAVAKGRFPNGAKSKSVGTAARVSKPPVAKKAVAKKAVAKKAVAKKPVAKKPVGLHLPPDLPPDLPIGSRRIL